MTRYVLWACAILGCVIAYHVVEDAQHKYAAAELEDRIAYAQRTAAARVFKVFESASQGSLESQTRAACLWAGPDPTCQLTDLSQAREHFQTWRAKHPPLAVGEGFAVVGATVRQLDPPVVEVDIALGDARDTVVVCGPAKLRWLDEP